MYENVIVYDGDTGAAMSYSVYPGENRFNGYVEDNVGRRYEFVKTIPTYHTDTRITRSNVRKPSIYKRPFLGCRKDEYKHAFTNKIRKTTEETHNVYYNQRRDRFIDKVSTNHWFNETYGFSYE